jgi:hypothetical protein
MKSSITESEKWAAAAESANWAAAVAQAKKTATWAKTMTRVLITNATGKQPKWEIVNFLGPKKAESRGIVDLLAIRRDHSSHGDPLKYGDLFEIVLIQVKGGTGKKPTASDNARLWEVGKRYAAREILLAEWKLGSQVTLRRLRKDLSWSLANVEPSSVFAPKKVKGAAEGGEAAAVRAKVRRLVG